MDFTKDYYRILGVFPSASLNDIRRAYRVQALRWHPDRHAGESPEKISEAEERFKAVNEAYAVLSDVSTKANYDFFYSTRRAQAKTQAHAQPQTHTHSQANNNTYRTATQTNTQSGESSWMSAFRGFAFMAAFFFYIVFPFSLVSGAWDVDHSSRYTSEYVCEDQSVLMKSAHIDFHAADVPEIVLSDDFEGSFGLEMKIKIWSKSLRTTSKRYQQINNINSTILTDINSSFIVN